jgi:hypothetical protein
MKDFKLGGGALRKIPPSGGRHENVCGISCEKSRFYTKKSYFFQLGRGGAPVYSGINIVNWGVRVMVFNTTFNNISVISWRIGVKT